MESKMLITSVTTSFHNAINNFYDDFELAIRGKIMFRIIHSVHFTKSSINMTLKSLQKRKVQFHGFYIYIAYLILCQCQGN